MKVFLPFMMEHPFISLFMLYTVCETTRQIICNPVKRLLRHLDIKRNGWPPEHCDADGDFKPEPEADESTPGTLSDSAADSGWAVIEERLPAVGDIIACSAEHIEGGTMLWAGTVCEIWENGCAIMETREEKTHRFVITQDTLWTKLPSLPNPNNQP